MNKTIFVIDDEFLKDNLIESAISFEAYLRDYPKLHEKRLRIVNLCDTRRYLSQGYYCSLLAESRNHEVIPSVHMINTLRHGEEQGIWFSDSTAELSEALTEEQTELILCMGEVSDPRFKKLATSVFRRYPVPLLLIGIVCEEKSFRVQLRRIGLADLNGDDLAFCIQILKEHARISWRKQSKGKTHRWDMALLVNPLETNPPSNTGAINQFVKAGRKLGIHVDVVTAADMLHINHYDALFIRETTAVDHHTYRLACSAAANNLVVFDDPDSILRCCNKVFLHDAFSYQNVLSPKTLFISRSDAETIEHIESEFAYPMVIKMPEGSFSNGVFKADSRQELSQKLTDLLEKSALVLVQEFLYTDHDWRIGILNGRALYACRYHMAKNHWQIYNHKSKRNFSGGFDTLPTFEVPKVVLNAALKAAGVVGKGLYGIDIKLYDKRAYVIEVNDNPNIDRGIEDKYLGEELYMQIMSEFLRQLELRGA